MSSTTGITITTGTTAGQTISVADWPELSTSIQESKNKNKTENSPPRKFDKKDAIGSYHLATAYNEVHKQRLELVHTHEPARDPRTNVKTRACWHIQRGDDGKYGVCTHLGCTFAHSLSELRPPECRFGEDCHNETCRFWHPFESKLEFFERRTDLEMPDLPETSEETYKPRAVSEPRPPFQKDLGRPASSTLRHPAVKMQVAKPVSKPITKELSFASLVKHTEEEEQVQANGHKNLLPRPPKCKEDDLVSLDTATPDSSPQETRRELERSERKKEEETDCVTVRVTDTSRVNSLLTAWTASCKQGLCLIVGPLEEPDCVFKVPRTSALQALKFAEKFPSYKLVIPSDL